MVEIQNFCKLVLGCDRMSYVTYDYCKIVNIVCSKYSQIHVFPEIL